MPPHTTGDKAAVIRYWHGVELLSPQTVPSPSTRERSSPREPVVHDLSRNGALVLPWSPHSRMAQMAIPPNRTWSHLIYCHCFDYRRIVELLEQRFGADNGYRDTRGSIAGLYALRFTAQGKMVEDSFVLSSAAWLAGRIHTGREWLSGFEGAQSTAAEIAAETLEGVVTPAALEAVSEKIIAHLSLTDFFSSTPSRYICRSIPVRPGAEDATDDPLNSFFLDDLTRVASSVAEGESSAALEAYLSQHDGSNRVDLGDDASSATQCGLLAHGRYPAGCWPTPGDLGLVHSQQLAVNAIRNGLERGAGLLSVNGPPGTGKTTLLRDIVAAVITNRADALARLATSSEAFLAKGDVVDADKNRGYWQLHPDLLGHEIVVASSNNGAIENVTLELPQIDKVDASWLDEYDLYSDIASVVSGQPAWGLVSAALGSKKNRSAFVDAFWSGVSRRKSSLVARAAEQSQKLAGAGGIPDDEVNVQEEGAPGARAGLLQNDQMTSPGALRDKAAATGGVDEAAALKGMEAWLNGQRKNIPAAEKAALWEQAVQRYQDAKRGADLAAQDALRISSLLRRRHEVCKELPKLQQAIAEAEAGAKALLSDLEDRERAIAGAEALLEEALAAVAVLLKRRPGFWANLFSFWRAGQRWAQEVATVTAQRELAQGRCKRIDREIQTLLEKAERQRRAYTDAKEAADRAHREASRLTSEAVGLARQYGAEYLRVYLETGVVGRGEKIELAEPWSIPGWRRARAKVFLEAMRLHQTLFQLESSRVFTNLTFAKVVLEGERYQNTPREVIRSVWGTLFMAVPVLSSTFASFARCFRTLGAGDIGWLLVDEAGQATPQAAVGALWRARRAVMVGDPLQLEPITQVPPAALEHMRRAFGVEAHWMPHQLSAQRLADLANPIGKEIGPEGSKVWVGLPLVVHRRCDRPMFEVANRIAYSGGMVYGTSQRVPDTPATLPSGWVQVRGTSSGNWVPSEGRSLNLLVTLLTLEGVPPESISVVTPFGDVIRQVGGGTLSKVGVTSGTIHTMQGKEADVVILVLGGNADPQRPGARGWVVAKPNMLNVAVTRAKRRLYVIGDRTDWEKRRYFSQVMDLLPVVNVEAALTRMEAAQRSGEDHSRADQDGDWQEVLVLSDKLQLGRPSSS